MAMNAIYIHEFAGVDVALSTSIISLLRAEALYSNVILSAITIAVVNNYTNSMPKTLFVN